MSTKKFFTMFFSILIIIFGAILLLNVFVDPFGLFGDKIYKWDSYNFTQNPRTAKINYIDRNKDKFDSYIVGSSGCGSISVNTINEYTNNSFYNCFYYGSDLMDSYNTIKYLSETTQVKNIFLGINYNTAMFFDVGDDEINQRMHGKASDKNLFNFYTSYLFANPRYSLKKIEDAKEDSFFQKSFDVFIPETGVYDKSIRDVENIGNYADYINKESYRVFKSYPKNSKKLTELESFSKYMKEIKSLCDENNINLQIVVFPIYWEDFDNYHVDELEIFYKSLSKVTDFWDFSKSTISADARYFYDSTHFRNSVGDMILAKIYNDESIYIPEDFGHYVNSENIDNFISQFKSYSFISDDSSYTKKVPIVMFHDIDGAGGYSVSKEQFERQMNLIKSNGFNTILFEDLYEYTVNGKELPENPIMITFDDGYQSNYDIAYPILKNLNMKATIYIIGSSFGKDTYKETGQKIHPHFGYDEAIEMYNSGLIDIQSHSYDMHQSEKFEESTPHRVNVKRFENEREKDYIEAFNNDLSKESHIIHKITAESIHSFSYPTGYFDMETETLLSLLGVKSTVTTETGVNTIIKGIPQSLYGLKRINIYKDMPDKNLVDLIS
ncbi:MAG: polysaccharide deacetylase family protein [Tissierellia bacterium]|nr:polysaccharide deacetylase family protein [Tissierellia bacterium]